MVGEMTPCAFVGAEFCVLLASGPVSYKENQKHLISGIFVFLSHFIAFSAKKITAESRKRERSESVIKTSIIKGLGEERSLDSEVAYAGGGGSAL